MTINKHDVITNEKLQVVSGRSKQEKNPLQTESESKRPDQLVFSTDHKLSGQIYPVSVVW